MTGNFKMESLQNAKNNVQCMIVEGKAALIITTACTTVCTGAVGK